MRIPSWWTLPIALCCALLAWAVQEPDAEEEARRTEQVLQQRVDRASEQLALQTHDLGAELARRGGLGWMIAHATALAQEHARTGTFFLGYAQDSLVCWTGPWDPQYVPLLKTSARHVRTPQGIFLLAQHGAGDMVLYGLRPAWSTPPIENRALARRFHPSLRAPEGLMATAPTSDGGVRDAEGVPMFRVEWRDGALELGAWLVWKFILAALAAAAMLWWLWQAFDRWAGIRHPLPAVLSFTALLAVLRILSLKVLPMAPLDRLPLFDPAIFAASFIFPSLGDLLINGLLFLVSAAFAHRSLGRAAPLPKGAFPAFLTWAVLLGLAAWVTHTLLALVNDSSIPLDLYHVQGLAPTSLLALAGMATFLGAWVLWADALLGTMLPGRNPLVVWATGLAALVLSIFLHHRWHVADTALFLWPVPLFLVVVQRRAGTPRTAQLLLGVACCALLVTHVLTRYTGLREQRERMVLAERLAVREDPVVEQLFRQVAPGLRRDRSVYQLLAGSLACDPKELDSRVRQRFFAGYWERYDVRLFAFSPSGRPICATDPEPPRSFATSPSIYADPAAPADMPDLFIEEQPGQGPFYHARVAIMPSDTIAPGLLIVELHPRSTAQELGFPALLLPGEDPLGERIQRYTYARYEQGRLVERSGLSELPMAWRDPLPQDGVLWMETDGEDRLARGSVEGTLILLGLPLASTIDKATTFSYLFVLFSLLLALSAAVRTPWQPKGRPAPGIGAKVRLALVLFAAAGAGLFGWGTLRLLERQHDQRLELSVLEKTASVHQELQHRFDGEPPLDRSHAPYLEHLLARLSNVFFSDITVYTLNGEMLATSRPQIFALGLLGPRMDPEAYARLALDGHTSHVHRESIGTTTFQTAYMPLRDRRGQVLAYLALPGFADQAQQQEERAEVLVAVLNLFVLLFALSILVALFISNRTTRPLDLLKNALARVELQQANEPIRYRGDDEVGQLVEVYNRKVEELRESAERLARSERESAWREMARQVAHEIKNPLTPMKLSIQHFQRTWNPDAPDASERLDRFSRGMVEQIDTLSGIASAFSNFAQMPRAKAEDLDLAEVAEAAMSVFRATPGMRCELRREAAGPLPVHADREQLLRVFNNLIKNAVQAIPEGQEGRISVVLRQANGEAIAEVHDNGTGIAEEDRERIFRPNFTTKGSGMGLGLAMVQRMVEGAGGRVWFESRVGEGSTFFVALPLGKA